MKPATRSLLAALAFTLAGLTNLHADVRLPAIFSEHMVLQRDANVPVWGWADAGEKVTVSIAGQTKNATADAVGKWSVELGKLSVGEPLTLMVSGKNKIAVHDVLVGEVWLCSGQSNMHFRMNRVENSQQEIAAANHPKLRFFSVDEQFAQQPATNLSGEWKLVSPATASECSAVAYYFARALQERLGVPIGLVVSSIGGTRIETWMQPETLARMDDAKPLLEKWKNVTPDEFGKIAANYRAFQQRRDHGGTNPAQIKPPTLRCHDCPGALHNGMIAPLQPFAIRGVLWYQGEANVGRPAAYEKLQPAMIADWRRVWGEEMPFLFVQLPPFQSTHPAFREAQLRIWQKTPRTAMAVTTDVGDAKNIHPTRKRPVGERLALAARALCYGEKIEYSGPVFERMTIETNRAVLSFTHIGQGLVAHGDSLKGFTIAGADGKFIPATAVIDGSNVLVNSEKIIKPVAVRYGWAMLPDGNLFNRDGLPASPFRTDNSL
jgi:sialate O-acetylesterase